MSTRNIYRNIVGVSFNYVLAIAINLPFGIILTRAIGPRGNGLLASMLVIPSLISAFAMLGIRKSTIFHIGKDQFKIEDIISSLFYLLLLSCTLIIVGSGIAFYYIDNPNYKPIYLLLVFASIPFEAITRYSMNVFVSKEQYKKFNFFQWIPSLLKLILAVILLVIFKMNLTGALIVMLAKDVLMAIVSLKIISGSYKLHFKPMMPIIKSLLTLGILNTIPQLLIRLHYRVDIFLLERLSSLENIGYYSLASRFAEKWQIPFAMGVVITTSVANRRLHKNLPQDVNRLIRLSVIAGIIGFVILYFAAPILIPLLYGKKFIPSIHIIENIIPGVFTLIFANIFISWFSGSGRPLTILWAVIPSLALNIFLNLLLIPRFHAIGSAWATDVSYSVATILLLILYSYDIKTPIRKIFKYNKSDFEFRKMLSRKPQKDADASKIPSDSPWANNNGFLEI